jgi:pilus assembly protein CpaE
VHQSTVVLGMDDAALQEEVLHFLDRRPGVRVVAATHDAAAVGREIRQTRPDAAVLSPVVLRDAAELDGSAVLVVAERETTEALRAALRAGARGFYLWPEEREALGRDAESTARPSPHHAREPGKAVAVYGARGGSGVTFLATNLAAACAARGADTVLVDLDQAHGDVAAALGIPPGETVPTLADLQPVLDELSTEHLERVLHAHPRGFHVLVAPHQAAAGIALDRSRASALLRVLHSRFDVVLLHLPRTLDEATTAVLEGSDEIFLTVTLDVLAFREARRLLSYLEGLGAKDRCRLVINRAGRSEVVSEDAARVFGMRPVAVIRNDRAVGRAQNRGELVTGRSGPAARQIGFLAKRLVEGDR